jgi:plasmid stability protein
MRTTLNINDDLYREVKVDAARRGVSTTSIIEEALRMFLRPQASQEPPDFPVSTRSGGVRPGVNLGDPDDMYQLLYGNDDRRAAMQAGVNSRDDLPA